jgi:hypothetical protein
MMKSWRFLIFAAVLSVVLIIPAAAADRPSDWAAGEVETAIGLDLVPDALQGSYTQPITRDEFAGLLMSLQRAWEKDGVADRTADELDALTSANAGKISDTKDADAVCCAALGIMTRAGGRFDPDGVPTRQQAAVILYKACAVFASRVTDADTETTTAVQGYASFWLPHTWADGADIRSTARSAVNWCYRHNVLEGVGGNAVDADGSLTREQAILTVLRLYYANGQPEKSAVQNAPDYYPVYDGYQNIAGWFDSALARHTTDEIGYLSDPEEKISLVYDNEGVGCSYGHLIDEEGNWVLTDLWGTGGYFHGAVIDYPYVYVELNFIKPHDEDAPLSGVVNIETGETWPNKQLEDVVGKDGAENETGPAVIKKAGKNQYCLTSGDGTVLSDIYENELRYIGDHLYIGWTSDQPHDEMLYCAGVYDVIWCDGVSMARVVRKEEFRFNSGVFDLDGGVYAIQNTDTKITVFDAFGDTLSTINTDSDVCLVCSANGLLCLSGSYGAQFVYYTQTGIALPVS